MEKRGQKPETGKGECYDSRHHNNYRHCRTDLRLWNRHNGVVAVKGYVRKGGENMGKIIGGGYGGGDGYGYGDGGGGGYGDGYGDG